MTPPATHILRASLKPRLYRDIEIESTASLRALAEAIVGAFDFDFDHAFGFYSRLTGHVLDSPVRYELFEDMEGDDTSRGVARTAIARAFPRVGSRMLFLFDYGDEWRFRVEVIGLGQRRPRQRYPKVVAVLGKAPLQYPGVAEEEEE